MTQVFFLLSFPYANAHLEKSLRAELYTYGFSLVYCQNLLSQVNDVFTDHKVSADHKVSLYKEWQSTQEVSPFYKHAQCRSFLLWENADALHKEQSEDESLSRPKGPYGLKSPCGPKGLLDHGNSCVQTVSQGKSEIPALAAFHQLHKWKKLQAQGAPHKKVKGTSLEKICLHYNGELLAAAITTSNPCKPEDFVVHKDFSVRKDVLAAVAASGGSFILSGDSLRNLLALSFDDLLVHLSLENSLCLPLHTVNSFQGSLPFLLDRRPYGP